MARQRLQVQIAHPEGTALAYVTPTSEGLLVSNTPDLLLLIRNVAASPVTVTVPVPLTFDRYTLGVSAHVITVAPGTTRVVSHFIGTIYAQPATPDHIYLDFSDPTNTRILACIPGWTIDDIPARNTGAPIVVTTPSFDFSDPGNSSYIVLL